MSVVFLTSASVSPWSLPGDWQDAGHTVELVGAGGQGFQSTTGTSYVGGSGGAGGGYTKLSASAANWTTSIAFAVSAQSTSATRTTNATYWENTTNTNSYYAEAGAGAAAAGASNAAQTGGSGNQVAGTPSVTYSTRSGNNGGGSGALATTPRSGGGGGGAAGPSGAGGAGGTVTGTAGGSGGGGSNGGTAGANTSTATGGNGGGTGGGTGSGSGAGGNATGTTGGGGGGGFHSGTASATTSGGAASDYEQIFGTDATHGAGGGGGGGGGNSVNTAGPTVNGGAAAAYGGGGGGCGGTRTATRTATQGAGGGGLIVITYTSYPAKTVLLLHGDGADAATNILDSGPDRRTVTLVGNAQLDTAQQRFGVSSILFDGTGDYITLDGNTDFALGGHDFTIDLWVRLNATGATQYLYDARAASGDVAGSLYVSSTNKVMYATAGTDRITGTTSLGTGSWYHVAVTRKNGSTKLWLNGAQEGSTYTDANVYIVGASRPAIASNGATINTNTFNGWLDEVRVINGAAMWDAAFTSRATPYYKPIAHLLLHGEGADASTTILDSGDGLYSPHAITANGNAQIDTAQAKFGSASILFDGTGDYLALDGNLEFNIGTADFTLDLWIRLNASGSQQTILDFRSAAANEVRPELHINSSSILVYFVSNAAQITGSTVLLTNTWYHVALARQGTSTKLFLNGAQEGSTYSDSNNYGTIGANKPRIGLDYNSANGLNGWLDEVRFLGGEAVWTTTFTPPTAPYSYAKTVLLLHGEGLDASVNIGDSSDPVKAVTVAGNAQIDTAQFKFGAASLLFDGSGDYLTLDGSSDFVFGKGDFTIDFWVRFNSLTGEQPLFGWTNAETAIYKTAANTIAFVVSSAAIDGTTSVSTGVWYHVALTRYQGSTRLFLNGIQEGATYSDSNNYSVDANGPAIGKYIGSAAYLNGWIDSLRVVKGAAEWISNFVPPRQPWVGDEVPLSLPDKPEVLLLHCNGADASTTITDSSAYTRTVNVFGNAQLDTAKKRFGISSILVDGTGDYITLPFHRDLRFGYRDFTIDFWFYRNASGSIETLFDWRPVGGEFNYRSYMSAAIVSNSIQIYVAQSTPIAGSVTLSTGVWYHFALTRMAAKLRMFVNGTQDGSTYDDTRYYIADENLDRPVFLGSGYGPGNEFNGWIDELRIVNGRALWTNNFIPHSRPYHGH